MKKHYVLFIVFVSLKTIVVGRIVPLSLNQRRGNNVSAARTVAVSQMTHGDGNKTGSLCSLRLFMYAFCVCSVVVLPMRSASHDELERDIQRLGQRSVDRSASYQFDHQESRRCVKHAMCISD